MNKLTELRTGLRESPALRLCPEAEPYLANADTQRNIRNTKAATVAVETDRGQQGLATLVARIVSLDLPQDNRMDLEDQKDPKDPIDRSLTAVDEHHAMGHEVQREVTDLPLINQYVNIIWKENVQRVETVNMLILTDSDATREADLLLRQDFSLSLVNTVTDDRRPDIRDHPIAVTIIKRDPNMPSPARRANNVHHTLQASANSVTDVDIFMPDRDRA